MRENNQPEIVVDIDGDYCLVRNIEVVPLLRNKGIGIDYGGKYLLHIAELLYLLENKKFNIKIRNTKLQDLLLLFKHRFHAQLWDLYVVYRDLRKRGFIPRIVKEAPHPTILFSKGKESEIKYSVFILSEGRPVPINHLINLIEKAMRNKRIPIFAIVDKDGNISYYEAIKAL